MTFTYDATNPAPTALELVRKRIGDTQRLPVEGQIFQDEEINPVLTAMGNDVLYTAQAMARMVLAKWARETDASGAGINIQRSQKSQQMKDVLDALAAELSTYGQPQLVGSSTSQADTLTADADYPNTPFKLGWGKNT